MLVKVNHKCDTVCGFSVGGHNVKYLNIVSKYNDGGDVKYLISQPCMFATWVRQICIVPIPYMLFYSKEEP